MTREDSLGVEDRFAHYLWEKAPAWALGSDQRFSYYAYVPLALRDRASPVPLVVVIHGTLRQPQVYRDEFVEFAEEHECAVLAPLFPAGVVDTDDIDNYKRLEFTGIRFDKVLIEMVDEFSRRYALEFEPWLLHGFSGGGQFAHRFYYLYPQLLAAVSVGAPGAVTLLDDSRKWWVGIADVTQRFDRDIDEAELRKVPVLLVIGAQDFGTEETMIPPGSRHWMTDANRAGTSRQEKLDSLYDSLQSAGIDVRLIRVPEADHKGRKMTPVVCEFFSQVLNQRQGGEGGIGDDRNYRSGGK
ncbi:MAG: hypothetical protein ACTIC1_16700 [Brevibacterium sp.]